MKYLIAYCLVILLAPFCFTLGTFITTIPVAGCLAWASAPFRCVVAGTLSGLGGVAAAVAFGYFVFRLVLGSSAFGLFPLLAATVPLIFPIRKELARARLLFNDVTGLRSLLREQGTTGEDSFAEDHATAVGLKFRAVAAVLGLVLAFLWFFLVHEHGNRIVMQPGGDTFFIIIGALIGLVWLSCLVVCVLKGKIWSAIIGIVSAVGTAYGWSMGGWYVFNPFEWVPVFAAVRIGRPDFPWAKWFYGPRKMAKAQERFPN